MNNSIKSRDTFVDSIRGVAIFLVVFGHFIEPYIGYEQFRLLYLSIYLFHMPLFVFITGIFVKTTLNERDYTGIIKGIFIPLLVFQILYKLFVYFYPSGYGYGPLVPHSILWFLLSLIMWRIFAPFFLSPVGLSISIMMALVAGYFPQIGYDLSLARTVYFFPFFIFGGLYGKRILQIVSNHRMVSCVLFAACILIGIYWFQNGLYQHALYGTYPYKDKGISIADYPMIGRFLVFLLSLTTLISFCAFIPTKSRMLQLIGTSTIAIYLLHQFFALGVNGQGWKIIPNQNLLLLVCFAGSLALCWVLSFTKPWVDKAMDVIAVPFEWINKSLNTRA